VATDGVVFKRQAFCPVRPGKEDVPGATAAMLAALIAHPNVNCDQTAPKVFYLGTAAGAAAVEFRFVLALRDCAGVPDFEAKMSTIMGDVYSTALKYGLGTAAPK